MKITLKDGSVKEYDRPMSVIEIAADLSEGLARAACAGEVDGEEVDLRTVVDKDAQVNILTARDEKGLAALRHTASHVMAQAVKRLYPNTKLAIGPSIADGFYYDMEFESPLTSDDFEKIEAEMKKIVKEDLKIERFTKPRQEAIAYMQKKGEPYKVELIEDLPEGDYRLRVVSQCTTSPRPLKTPATYTMPSTLIVGDLQNQEESSTFATSSK